MLTPQKIVFKLSEVMVGSGIRKKPIPDPRSWGPKGTGSRIPDTVLFLLIQMGIIFGNF